MPSALHSDVGRPVDAVCSHAMGFILIDFQALSASVAVAHCHVKPDVPVLLQLAIHHEAISFQQVGNSVNAYI